MIAELRCSTTAGAVRSGSGDDGRNKDTAPQIPCLRGRSGKGQREYRLMREKNEAAHQLPSPEESLAQACDAWHRGTPKAELEVSIIVGRRNLSTRLNGTEERRQMCYAGSIAWHWSDEHLPRGESNADRHCTLFQKVPIGTLVRSWKLLRNSRRKGLAKLTFGLVGPSCKRLGKGRIMWLKYHTRPNEWQVRLPDESIVTVPRT